MATRNVRKRRHGLPVVRATVLLLIAGAALAQGERYPQKTVRILTAEAGGGNDYAARVIAQGLTPALG